MLDGFPWDRSDWLKEAFFDVDHIVPSDRIIQLALYLLGGPVSVSTTDPNPLVGTSYGEPATGRNGLHHRNTSLEPVLAWFLNLPINIEYGSTRYVKRVVILEFHL